MTEPLRSPSNTLAVTDIWCLTSPVHYSNSSPPFIQVPPGIILSYWMTPTGLLAPSLDCLDSPPMEQQDRTLKNINPDCICKIANISSFKSSNDLQLSHAISTKSIWECRWLARYSEPTETFLGCGV